MFIFMIGCKEFSLFKNDWILAVYLYKQYQRKLQGYVEGEIKNEEDPYHSIDFTTQDYRMCK